MKRIINYLKRHTARVRILLKRHRLHNRSVSIVSSSCWGGFMYRYYNLPFNSPFIGLAVMSEDFIRILESPALLERRLVFIDPARSRYPRAVADAKHPYPVAVLDGTDIEIHFIHYPDEKTAEQKWCRRLKRLDWDNAIIAYHDRDGFTPELLARFERLPYKQKVCFTAKLYPGCKSVVYLPEFEGCECIKAPWGYSDLHYDLAAAANALGR